MTVQTGPVVRLRGVGRRFGATPAVSDVDLDIHPGERVAFVGASGAGKSTLLALLNGSLSPTEGTVEVFGSDINQLTGARLRRVQRRIGAIHQDLALIEQVRVLHNVNAGRLGQMGTFRGLTSLVWPGSPAPAKEYLDRVDLGWALHECTERLSGGERQRVAIARLLAQSPEIVVADEPVSSLDPVRARNVLELLTTWPTVSALVVSLHQPALARTHCTRVVGLRAGRIVLDVPAAEATDDALQEIYEWA